MSTLDTLYPQPYKPKPAILHALSPIPIYSIP